MEKRSEEINLEYMVEFKEGLSPVVKVYALDSDTGRFHITYTGIGVGIGAGYRVEKMEIKKSKEKCPSFSLPVEEDIFYQISESSTRVKAEFSKSKPENWEQDFYEDCRKKGVNCIKVKNPEHIEVAIERHKELYAKQFQVLGMTFKDLFEEFIRKHPIYEHPPVPEKK